MRMLIFAGTALLALSACSDAGDAETDVTATDTEAVAGNDAAAPAAPADAVPTTGQEFATMAAASDMYEIEAGKMAQQMGKSQAVKDFGRMMVEDHTKATADLKAAAGQAEGINVSAQLNAKQKSDLDALRSAGENFDEIYAQQQVAAHTQALAMLRGFAERGDVQPLKDFAAKTAPVVEGHLTNARSLP